MRIGLFMTDTGEPDTLVDAVLEVERDGFDSVWFSQTFGNDALTLIALAGRETERIELGTSVVPVYPHHPFAFAQQAATVQAVTNGRLTLGIGLSHHPVVESMWGMSYEKPARYMREYLNVLRPLLDDGKVSFSGDVFRVSGSIQSPRKERVPVVIAALSPVMLRIAGELADGTVTWMTGVKTIREHTAPGIKRAAERAGRPPPRVVVALPVAVTDDPAAARERVAQAFQIYGHLPNYRRMLDREGAAGPADVAVTGNEAEVEQQLRALAGAGATDFVAPIVPAGDNAAQSIARTRELLTGLVGRL